MGHRKLEHLRYRQRDDASDGAGEATELSQVSLRKSVRDIEVDLVRHESHVEHEHEGGAVLEEDHVGFVRDEPADDHETAEGVHDAHAGDDAKVVRDDSREGRREEHTPQDDVEKSQAVGHDVFGGVIEVDRADQGDREVRDDRQIREGEHVVLDEGLRVKIEISLLN